MPTFCCFPGVPGTELVLRLGGSLGDRRAQEAWATIVKGRRNGGGEGADREHSGKKIKMA